MQWRARKIATQASKLADQAGPMTKNAARNARHRAGTAADWAKPRVGRVRAWMAVRAARGSVSVQETVAPRLSAMLAAGAAAAAAMAIRNRQRTMLPPMPPRPSSGGTAEQPATVLNPSAEAEHSRREAEVNGLSRTR